MDLLVVGGSGFLGQEVTRRARLAGDRVVATFHRHALRIAALTGGGWTSGVATTSPRWSTRPDLL